VITADGVVGKILRVFKNTSQVLLINDQTSGVGSILEKSRLQGVLRGTPVGEVVLEKVMSDETVQPGEKVVTSGGDQIFPKGLPVGTVTKVSPGAELFLNIRVKPSADLSRLEEVLVITQEEEKQPTVAEGATPLRAADILAQRLPSVPERPPDDPNKPPPPTSGLKILPAPTSQATPGVAMNPKPGGTSAASGQSSSGQSGLSQVRPGQTSAPSAIPKPHVDSGGSTVVPGGVSSAPRQTGNPPATKPAITPKPASPTVNSPETTSAAPDGQSEPVSPKPEAQPKPSVAQPSAQEPPQ
jgi:rod shape-determining protein MreC